MSLDKDVFKRLKTLFPHGDMMKPKCHIAPIGTLSQKNKSFISLLMVCGGMRN